MYTDNVTRFTILSYDAIYYTRFTILIYDFECILNTVILLLYLYGKFFCKQNRSFFFFLFEVGAIYYGILHFSLVVPILGRNTLNGFPGVFIGRRGALQF